MPNLLVQLVGGTFGKPTSGHDVHLDISKRQHHQNFALLLLMGLDLQPSSPTLRQFHLTPTALIYLAYRRLNERVAGANGAAAHPA